MFKTIAEIKLANRRLGNYWFSHDTLAFFKSKVYPEIYGGKYFVTSEKGPHGPRGYAVRKANGDGSISNVSSVLAYSTLENARVAARLAAA